MKIEVYKYDVGDVVNSLLITSRVFGAFGRESKRNDVYYNCTCKKCDESFFKREMNMEKGCNYCNISDKNIIYHYDIGDTLYEKFLILSRRYGVTKSNKDIQQWYNLECLECGYIHEKSINTISLKRGCPCCSSKVTVEHINSIVANEETHWMVDYFQGGWNEAKLYTPQSGKRVNFKCPICKTTKKNSMEISSLYSTKSIGCFCIGRNKSFPEKYMSSFLDEVNIKYTNQKIIFDTSCECKKYRKYDFYIEVDGKKIIIETHGIQHYRYSGFNRTLEEEQENDRYKEQLAKDNDIDYYITIDCREYDANFIKDNITKSEIIKILKIDVNNINWDVVELNADRRLVYEVCEYKSNNKNISIKEMASIFDLSKNTIKNFLELGAKNGICDYDKYFEMKNNKDIDSSNYRKEVVILSSGEICHYSKSIKDASDYMLNCHGEVISAHTVSKYCKNNKKRNVFSFKYVYTLSPEELQDLNDFKNKIK